jgi:hypothetical protein
MPLLGICPKECKSVYNRDTCTSVFITAQAMETTDALQLMKRLRKYNMYTQWNII